MADIIIISFLNGITFALSCFLISFFILDKKEISIKRILYAFIPFLISYYCILCLFDSLYAMFFSGIYAFLFIKIIFQESNFMALFLSILLNDIKIFLKIILLTIINNDNYLLLNTYKTLEWSSVYLNTLALFIGLIIIFIFRKKLRGLIKILSTLKRRGLILLIVTYISFIIIILYQPPVNLFSFQTITDSLIIFVVTGLGMANVNNEEKWN